ncbi:hypothetical protein BBL81_19035 [Vibrio parahaemolyticus]|uniref:hypothetical protein n=1 Tax=Vibrio parahaemolyticus TaxID=670 RepID=UPI0006A582A4|nr:hypothetical protein [Vibrio parahaemolyticus]EGQ8282748.1 hypothetical protein [Vibrio parahaemolyticus]EGQ8331888.1 hypothetical protein [Vibrio parahaemolyticus]EHR6922415.1 hypothetical protein [Vibrio parahaemolyticus]EJG0030181.1 hypothetical protein [Vibrio parahaemolyticus]KOE13983.1 hypothetical protein ACS90_18555 [Vibrio parahaemolyticus]
MRISPTRRRRWNNILILGIIAFIVILNAPMWIKTYLLSENIDPYPHLLRTDHSVSAIYANSLELEFRDGRWHANADVPLPLSELIARWQSLEGTELNSQQYEQLKPSLSSPESIEVWYQGLEEPQRITFYRLDDFWLFKNWQDKWIAISVDSNYIMPK